MTDKRRALITGITGQDGSYLAELLPRRRVRGRRHGAARQSTENFEPHRAPASISSTLVPGRPARPALADQHPRRLRSPTRSTTSPRRASCRPRWQQPVLTGEFTAARRHPDARGDPPGRPGRFASTRRPRRRCSGRCRRCRRPRTRRSIRARPTVSRRSTATGSPSTTASRTTSSLSPGSSSTTRAHAVGSSS